MTYVMSDIHGCYGKYRKMLKRIGLKDSDSLYVIGDAVDRGKAPVKVLGDMMARPNILPIMGNHEVDAIHFISAMLLDASDKDHNQFFLADLRRWVYEEQGAPTYDQFVKLSVSQRKALIDYMRGFSLYEIITVVDKKYVLAHSGVPEGATLEKLENKNKYSIHDFRRARTDYQKQYFDDGVFFVTGHVPTSTIDERHTGRIYRYKNNIGIDTGVMENGVLGCLCLDTDEEFYV